MSDNTEKKTTYFTTSLKRLILLGIPVLNVIAALLWTYAGKDDETRAFGKAALLVIILFALLTLVLGLTAFTFLSTRLFELIPG